MAAVASHLADTSALARLRHEPVAMVLGPLIEAGLVATCGVIEFELGWAARTSAEFDELRADRDIGYEWLATRDEDWRRALAALRRRLRPDRKDHRTASAMGCPARYCPVTTPNEPHPRGAPAF